MMPIQARAVYIKREAYEDPRAMERVDRMLPFIHCESEPVVIDDEGWYRLVLDGGLNSLPRHGRNADTIEPIVIFNAFLYDHTPEERDRRREKFPKLFRTPGTNDPYSGYGGWEWRKSGADEYRRTTGLVCQPAYAIHSIWGCHFRCSYCDLGGVANVYVNLDDWIDRIRAGLGNLNNAPDQTLFQWDNGADVVCWEPEYGATRLLVDLFARTPGKHLELYVGKSDHVDYLLDYDHRGHTVCCWSIAAETQCRDLEKRTASLEDRLRAARRCEDAGYPVRMRLSPMVPIAGWQDEIPHMLRRIFEETSPEMLTIEPLRFYTYDQLVRDFAPGVLDAEFVDAMRDLPDDTGDWHRREFPDELRQRMFALVLDEVARLSPATPVAFCREKRTMWDALQSDLARMGQHPDDYVCNCGPRSVGPDARLLPTVAPV